MSLEYPQNSTGCTNILLIDNSVPSYQTFVSSASNNTFPIVYSHNSTKTELLSVLQANFTTISRIGVCFIANLASTLFLDNAPFFVRNEALLGPYSENVTFLISIITQFNIKNIDFLACNTLHHPPWLNYYQILNQQTTVIVGASNDRTGNIKYGGDWVLESTNEDIELIYFTESIKYYTYLLDVGHAFLFINTDGSVYYTGIIGNTTTQYATQLTAPAFQPVNSISTVDSISSGDGFAVFKMTNETLLGIGSNDYGQLGGGDNPVPNDSPYQLTLPVINPPQSVVSVACGSYHTVLLMSDGSVWGCGNNIFGQLANSTYDDTSTFTKFIKNDSGLVNAKSIACGGYHTIVLMQDGSVWGSGYNDFGQTSNSGNSNVLRPMIYSNSSPVINVQSIACGTYHTIILMQNGTLWSSGYNSYGQLGQNSVEESVSNLSQMQYPAISGVDITSGVKSIKCGIYLTLVLMQDGTCWYSGFYPSNSALKLTRITSLPLISSIASNYYNLYFLTNTTVLGVGSNIYYELSLDNTIPQPTPIKMRYNKNRFITDVQYIMNNTPISIADLPIATICYPRGTPILTDQGIYFIEQLIPEINTINNKPIVDITQTITADKYLVCFEKNSLALNCPTDRTVMSRLHKIYYNGKLIEANKFVNNKSIHYVPYNGEILYNILMDDYSTVSVNCIICETLDPNNIIAKLYSRKCKYTNDKKEAIIKLLMQYDYNKDYINYNKLINSC